MKKWLWIFFIFGIFSFITTQPVFASIDFNGESSKVDVHDTMEIYED